MKPPKNGRYLVMKDEKVKIRFDSFEYNLLIKIIDKAEGKRYGKDDH